MTRKQIKLNSLDCTTYTPDIQLLVQSSLYTADHEIRLLYNYPAPYILFLTILTIE